MMAKKQRSKKGKEPPVPSPASVKREKEKAKALRASVWWQNQLAKGECHYCGLTFAKKDLTMDHIVPVSRSGKSPSTGPDMHKRGYWLHPWNVSRYSDPSSWVC